MCLILTKNPSLLDEHFTGYGNRIGVSLKFNLLSLLFLHRTQEIIVEASLKGLYDIIMMQGNAFLCFRLMTNLLKQPGTKDLPASLTIHSLSVVTF